MRNLKKISVGIALSFCLLFALLSNALAASKYKDYPVPQACLDQVKKEGSKLNIYDWAEWWPEDLFKNFTKEFGVEITRDHYADTEEMVTKFKLNPNTPYDLVLGAGPKDFVRLKALGALREINHDWIPNVDAYLMDQYKNMEFDPGNRFQLIDTIFLETYTFNTKYVDPNDPLVGSWGLLFEGAKKYKGKTTMIDNYISTIGAALKYLGYSYTTDNEKELIEARNLLMKQKPYLMAYDSWPKTVLVQEEAWLSHLWVGDSWLLSREVRTMRGVLPKEGTYIAGNTDFLPKGGKHPAAAHLFLNYLFRTEVNAMLTEFIGYPPVHKHVMELMSKEMKAWPGFVLDEEYLRKCESFDPKLITGKGHELRVKIWQDIKQ